MTAPNARERKALAALQFEEWEHKAQLYVGEKTLADLTEKGWIAPFQGHNPNGDRFSITDLGRDALALPQPATVRTSPGLKQLPPILRPLRGPFDPPEG
jgi:hypothetical protein